MSNGSCYLLEPSVPKTDLTEISVRLWLLELEADAVEWSLKENSMLS